MTVSLAKDKMSVLILSKGKNSYETTRLVESFNDKNIEVNVAHSYEFSLCVNSQNTIKHLGKNYKLPDVVLLRAGAGTSDFTLSMAKEFAFAGVTVINEPKAIENARNKLLTSQILSRNNIPTPKTLLIQFPVNPDFIESEIGFPCVVKYSTGSKGNHVYLCKDKDELLTTTALMSNKNHKKMVLIQEYIGSKFGEDLRVIVIGGKVVGIMKRKSVNGDFRANISKGGQGEKYPATDEIQEISIKASNLLGLQIAGIDLLFDGDNFRVCEANACPGFKGFEKYCNFNIADHITEYIIKKGQMQQ